jgi:hypothetical protein
MLLRRIFGPKRGDGTEFRRSQSNEELKNVYSSANIRVMK